MGSLLNQVCALATKDTEKAELLNAFFAQPDFLLLKPDSGNPQAWSQE